MSSSVVADMIIYNGKVAALDSENTFYEAVAIKNGWITYVGTNDEVLGRKGSETKVIDLKGKLLLPAANDAHLHASLTGLTLEQGFLNVSDPKINSVKALQDAIAEKVRTKKPGEWVYGSGLMEFMIKECAEQGRKLTRFDLDPVSQYNPVMLTDFGLHSLLVNSKAMEVAGLTDDFPTIPPEAGIVERDATTGKLNGRFEEWSAHHLIGKHAPPLSEAALEAAITRVQQALNKEGITSHTDCIGQGLQGIFFGMAREEIAGVYEKMRKEGKLTARVSLTINPCKDGIESYKNINSTLDGMKLPEFHDRNWVKADAIKLFGDQGLWLRDGNPFPGGTGRSVFPGETNEDQVDELTRTIVDIHKKGWQVCIHAIGGKTIDTAIDAFAEAQERAPRRSPRHYVIHADDLIPANAEKMAKYDIGASVQPIACNIVAGMRAPVMTAGEKEFDWQSYIDKGVSVAGGTDAPCFSFNWRVGVQFAVTRTTMSGEAVRPDLSMNLTDAIRMYTYYGAYQEHMEDVRGSIEINKLADLQVLGRDIFTCPLSEISQIPVEMTICAGKVVYDAAANAN